MLSAKPELMVGGRKGVLLDVPRVHMQTNKQINKCKLKVAMNINFAGIFLFVVLAYGNKLPKTSNVEEYNYPPPITHPNKRE